MGLLSRLGRGAARRAIKTGDGLNALANYLMITGAVGGGVGGPMGANMEQSAGGDPNEGAIGGARAGAMMGPLMGGALIGSGATGNPLPAAIGTVPYVLNVGSAASQQRLERERRAMEEEAIRRALEMRLAEMHGGGR